MERDGPLDAIISTYNDRGRIIEKVNDVAPWLKLYREASWPGIERAFPVDSMILDAGGGTGIFARKLANQGRRVVIADATHSMLVRALSMPASDGAVSDGAASDGAVSDGAVSDGAASDGAASDGAASDGAASDSAASDGAASRSLRCIEADIGNLGMLRSHTFDGVLCTQMLNFISDRKKVFGEFYRVLKPGGVLFCDIDGAFRWAIVETLAGRISNAIEILKGRDAARSIMGVDYFFAQKETISAELAASRFHVDAIEGTQFFSPLLHAWGDSASYLDKPDVVSLESLRGLEELANGLGLDSNTAGWIQIHARKLSTPTTWMPLPAASCPGFSGAACSAWQRRYRGAVAAGAAPGTAPPTARCGARWRARPPPRRLHPPLPPRPWPAGPGSGRPAGGRATSAARPRAWTCPGRRRRG